jgi:adenylate cyclase
MARIAEAEIESSPVLRGNATSEEIAELYVVAADSINPDIARLLEYAWRRHLQAALRGAALRRSRGTVVSSDGGARSQWATDLAVGFADLVGFTVLSQQLSEGALADVVDRFEELAYETIGQGGGRVVKMIGDEVMFAVDDASSAASIALALSAAYADDEMLSDVRVGLAAGPVLLREGDCFGPTVNLASRIVNIAAAGSVVVADEVHSRLADDERFAWKPIRPRYLKDIGRVPLWVLHQRGTEANRQKRRWPVREAVRERVEQAHAVGREVLDHQS